MRPVLALLLAVLLAGCSSVFGMCGPTDTAQWSQPGLYEALRDEEGATLRTPETGVPVGEALAAVYGAEARIVGVHHYLQTPTPEDPSAPVRAVSLYPVYTTPDFRLSVTLPPNATAEEARSMARAFLANVSGADAATQDAWADAIAEAWSTPPSPVAPGEPMPAPAFGDTSARVVETRIAAPTRAEAFLLELGLDLTPDVPPAMPGQAHPAQGPFGPWRFEVQLPTVEHEQRVAAGRMRLFTDGLGQTFGYVEHKERSDPNATAAAIRARIAELGLDPDRVPSAYATMVC